MMRKVLLVSLGLIFCLSLAVCGQKSSPVIPANANSLREVLGVIGSVYNALMLGHRAQQNYIDSNYVHHDTTRTDAGGFITVQLPFKYENDMFFVGIQPSGTGFYYTAGPTSDSSFSVTTTDASSVAVSAFVSYVTIGIKKRGK